MVIGLYSNDFGPTFSRLLEETGISRYKIHQFTGLDQGFLSRLCVGSKSPSPETIMKIALALVHYSEKITLHDVEDLFKSVGRSIKAN
jgi:transcriptional regulator with XRE-family HTH domain